MLRRLVTLRSSSLGLSAAPALIIAPHPDDEALGAGGLIAMKRAVGAPVTVAYLTCGEASHADCCDIDRRQVAEARRALSAEATKLLGVPAADLRWLGLKDGAIPRRGQVGFQEAALQLAKLIGQLRPAEIYAPHRLDRRIDHEAACELAGHAATLAGGQTRLFYYLVWGWFRLRLSAAAALLRCRVFRLDVQTALARKRAAIDHYFSRSAPSCGKPYCGVLPEGFVQWLSGRWEFFWLPRGQRPAQDGRSTRRPPP